MSKDSSEEKTDPASARKLQKLREDGTVLTSQDTVTSLTGVVMLIGLILSFGGLLKAFAGMFDVLFRSINMPFDKALSLLAQEAAYGAVLLIAPFLGIAILGGVLFKLVISGGWALSMSALLPKLERLDPVAGMGRMFGPKAWLAMFMTLVRMTALFVVLTAAIVLQLEDFQLSMQCGVFCGLAVGARVALIVSIAAAIVMLLLAVPDFLISRHQFLEQHKMTKTEVKQERKDTSGNPEIMGNRRKLHKDLLKDGVGLNLATHVFVGKGRFLAVRFVPGETVLPIVVARSRSLAALATARSKASWSQFHLPEVVDLAWKIEPGSYLDNEDALLRFAHAVTSRQ